MLSRRSFLSLGSAAAGALALGCSIDQVTSSPLFRVDGPLPLPDPATSGLDHIIWLMMENRSYDHMLGWLPRGDGKQGGLTYTDADGVPHRTAALAPDFQGCGFSDPDHSYEGARVEYNGGACDGWLRAGANDLYSIGYYRRQDLDFFAGAAPEWSTFDRYFCSVLGPTFPNKFYQHSAQTDRLENLLTPSTLPTIWDRLAGAGVSGRYYFSDLPFLGLWLDRYLPISRPISSFYEDCAAGTLPAVSYVEPTFLGHEIGAGSDDHPHADVRAGQDFMNRVYQAVVNSPAWPRTALIINYDEWGGFFDHVPPTEGPLPAADIAAGATDGLRGFRVPMLVISPFARRRYVSHVEYEHTSVLKMIEWRWGLAPLTVRDEGAANLAADLDFANPNLDAPVYRVPSFSGTPCPPATTTTATARESAAAPAGGSWRSGLRRMAAASGWSV